MKAKRNLVQAYLFSAVLLLARPAIFLGQGYSPTTQFNYATNSGTITITGFNWCDGGTLFGSGNVTVPSAISGLTVTRIEGNFFWFWCIPTNIFIPASVTNIGTGSLSCGSLAEITVDDQNSSYSSIDGILYDKNQNTIFQYPPGKAGNNYLISNGVTSIGDNAFDSCENLTALTIGNSVTNIGSWAFEKCNLTNVIIPDHVATVIGDGAFYDCGDLDNITIGKDVKSIGNNVFELCIALTNIVIPDSVTNIGDGVFTYCNDLTMATIGNGAVRIGNSAFYDCPNLISIVIGTNVDNIGNYAFYACDSLTNVAIPSSVTQIGDDAFVSCGSLTSIMIPNSVTNIGSYVFNDCSSLTATYFMGNAPNDDSTAFSGNLNTLVYFLPDTTGWGAMFGGAPTMLWLPQVQTSAASFGVKASQFGFNINWASGQTVVVEASTNLVDWQPVQTNMLTTGTSYFSDPKWTNYPGRYYRLRSP